MTPRRVIDFSHCHPVFMGIRDQPSILSNIYRWLLVWVPECCGIKLNTRHYLLFRLRMCAFSTRETIVWI